MITKFNLINEALTSKMFHFTSVRNLVNILKENTFFTTPVIGTGSDSDVNDGKFYYFAMQTSRHGKVAFAPSVATTGKVCINIDGKKLNQNFKSKRVDYWQTSRNPKDHTPQNYMYHLTRFDELEERIITNSPDIPNAKKFIEEIHVLINDDMPDYIARNMIDLKKHIKDVNIYFYDNEKYFDNQTKKYSIDVNDIDFEKNVDKDQEPHNSFRIPMLRVMGLIIMGDDEVKSNLYKWLKESKYVKKTLADRNRQFKGTTSELTIDNLYKKIEKDSKTDYDRYIRYISDFYLGDYISVISAEIHNNKSETNPISRHVIHTLTKDMSKHGKKNIKDYILHKSEIMKVNEKVLYV